MNDVAHLQRRIRELNGRSSCSGFPNEGQEQCHASAVAVFHLGKVDPKCRLDGKAIGLLLQQGRYGRKVESAFKCIATLAGIDPVNCHFFATHR